jgi:integrase
MLAEGLSASTIRNALMPLRVIFRRALEDGDVAVNPTEKLRLLAVRGKRDRVASPEEAAKLIAAVPKRDQAVWATAFYAGLRRGELLALRFEDIDLASGLIHISRAWDMREGVIEPKSRSGRRTVPIPAALRDFLVEHRMGEGRSEGLAFGRSATLPFEPVSMKARACTAWKNAKPPALIPHRIA